MAQPKVSVIVPIYGVEQYIERCARYLFEQTLDDIEYIFVDDKTKDNSVLVLQKVIEEYPSRINSIKIIRHKINKGLPQARKTGLENATGEYIAHCDSDDYIEKNAYELLYKKAKDGNLDLVYSDMFYEGRYTTVLKAFPNNNLDKDYLNSHCCSYTGAINVVTHFCKRTLYTENNIEFPTAMIYEDQMITSQLRFYANKIGYIQQPFYHYVISSNSMSNFGSEDEAINKIKQMKENTDKIISFFYKKKIDNKYILSLKLRSIVEIMSYIKTPKKLKTIRQDFYPEIKNGMYLNNNIPLIIRARYFLLSHHLYRIDHIIRHNATIIKIIRFFIH